MTTRMGPTETFVFRDDFCGLFGASPLLALSGRDFSIEAGPLRGSDRIRTSPMPCEGLGVFVPPSAGLLFTTNPPASTGLRVDALFFPTRGLGATARQDLALGITG